MLVHAKAPSGSGHLTACGIRPEKSDAIANHGERVTCVICLDAMKPSRVGADVPNTHYDIGGISTIDVIQAKLTPEQYKGFLLGNVIKYSLRLNWKGSVGEDAAKLSEYAYWLSATTDHNEESS